jgi:hypothetical protein
VGRSTKPVATFFTETEAKTACLPCSHFEYAIPATCLGLATAMVMETEAKRVEPP